MNMSWLSLIGGGITAAATLAVGISTSGILASNPSSSDLAPAAGETIYVEQPVIQVSDPGAPLATASVDPIVIAVLPAPSEADPSVAPDPSMSLPPYEDDDAYVEGEEDEYEDESADEDEYEDEHEYGDEHEHGDEHEGEEHGESDDD
jgi:hypothetical protein